jgi:hypothetical protein
MPPDPLQALLVDGCSVPQFFSVNFPMARAFTSSTKPVPEAGRIWGLQASTRSALEKSKKMGDSGEPWGTTECMGKASVF